VAKRGRHGRRLARLSGLDGCHGFHLIVGKVHGIDFKQRHVRNMAQNAVVRRCENRVGRRAARSGKAPLVRAHTEAADSVVRWSVAVSPNVRMKLVGVARAKKGHVLRGLVDANELVVLVVYGGAAKAVPRHTGAVAAGLQLRAEHVLAAPRMLLVVCDNELKADYHE
jgi:hypothetical protein